MNRESIIGLGLGLALSALQAASAATINHGDYVGSQVRYEQVTEDSSVVPVFSAPSLSANALDFGPTSFNALSTGGGPDGITTGTLTFELEALPGFTLTGLEVQEAGDYTLLGGSTTGTMAAVEALLHVTVLEIDGAPVMGGASTTPLFFAPSSGDWNIVDDGPGPQVSGIWTGGNDLDLLALAPGITKVSVELVNTLSTSSEVGSAAFIAKKDVTFLPTVDAVLVPEPVTGTLVLAGLCGLAFARPARRP